MKTKKKRGLTPNEQVLLLQAHGRDPKLELSLWDTYMLAALQGLLAREGFSRDAAKRAAYLTDRAILERERQREGG